MKVRPSVKPICEKCKVIKRHGKVMVICQNPKHKQTHGYRGSVVYTEWLWNLGSIPYGFYKKEIFSEVLNKWHV